MPTALDLAKKRITDPAQWNSVWTDVFWGAVVRTKKIKFIPSSTLTTVGEKNEIVCDGLVHFSNGDCSFLGGGLHCVPVGHTKLPEFFLWLSKRKTCPCVTYFVQQIRDLAGLEFWFGVREVAVRLVRANPQLAPPASYLWRALLDYRLLTLIAAATAFC